MSDHQKTAVEMLGMMEAGVTAEQKAADLASLSEKEVFEKFRLITPSPLPYEGTILKKRDVRGIFKK